MTVHPINRPEVDNKGNDITGAGVHAIIELYDCPRHLLNDETHVRDTIRRAAEIAGAHLLKLSSHSFSPQGVTALGLLSESHISIHTWPEAGYAAADMFTCGRRDSVTAAAEFMIHHLKAGRHATTCLERGEKLKGPLSLCNDTPL